jgi:predicted dehydrogenase
LKPVSWGILGCADIALKKVIPAMKRAQLCSIDAIASRTADKAQKAAIGLGIPRHYGSYEALLADSDIEAVYIPLPNHLHAQWTLRAAQAGKHVLCEKPLALSTAQAQEMIDGCRQAGVLLMEAFMYRLHPLWVKVGELLSSGQIGQLQAIQAFFSYHNVDPANIRNIRDFGGGALMDIGCYPINVARMLFGGEPTSVSGVIRRDPRFDTDVLSSAILDFGGRQATFTCSTQLIDDQRVHLVGTEGRLLVEIPFNIPPDIPTRILRFWGGDPPRAPNSEIYDISPADQYGVQGDAFSRAVRLGEPVPTPPEDALGNLVVIEKLLATSQ